MAKEQHLSNKRPFLFLDVDGVLSLFGFPPTPEQLPGPLHWVEGVAHCIPPENGPRLARLAERYELVWATGWEEKANEYLPHLLDRCLRDLPYLAFDGRAVFGSAHWKVDAIAEHAGDRPAAWIDDSLDDGCLEWAERRPAPTLVIRTDSAVGLTDRHVEELLAWADALERRAQGER